MTEFPWVAAFTASHALLVLSPEIVPIFSASVCIYVHFASRMAMFRSFVASLMSDIRVGFGGPMVLLYMALSVDSLSMVGWSRCLLSSNQSSGGRSSVVAVVCAASATVVLKKVV